MREMLRDLVAHKGYADAVLLTAIEQHPAAAADLELLELLHHILLANRFWMLTILGESFVLEEESRPAASLTDLRLRYQTTHAQETAWLAAASDADLERQLESPLVPGGRCTVAQGILQVCLHSQGHRAQCAKLLRQNGGEPPRMDFILWLADRSGANSGVQA
jgi:uncharacterized damage-inducible protein DinB